MFSEMGTTTLMMCLFFGTNALLCILFQVVKGITTASQHLEVEEKKRAAKELSKPFNGTIECFTNLTAELFRTGLILALTYICEKHPVFAHSEKHYSRDLFLFVLIIFFAYAFMTVKPVHDLSLLGREQTEEWKGWMQFIFLLYHYFHAEEVYNSVRVMITCYVWMTGFGNFSFFYMKQDYGWLRVAQMLWRLNFAVLLLMWTHGNTYILYYICPMHTFYFFMVYATMYVFASVNHSKWGIRFKLMVVGLLIFILWDINGGMFDVIFAWLGTDKVIGASRGSVWEWYFRTSLDHWSTFLGMIFALNFPIAEQYFTRAKGGPIIVAAAILGAATVWWFYFFYTLPKLEYNMTHSYYSIIPLLSYIFFRNITPYVRSGVSMSLHELGKTTLETYLLQHHIWLTSNAKTLLTIVPGHPWINFALASILFFVVSRELYRITMSLRGMVLPDDHNLSMRNIFAITVMFLCLYAVSVALKAAEPESTDVFLACLTVFVVSVLLINRFARSTSENAIFQSYSVRACVVSFVFIVFCFISQLTRPAAAALYAAQGQQANIGVLPMQAPRRSLVDVPAYDLNECYTSLCKGHWDTSECPPEMRRVPTAMCHIETWDWDQTPCPIRLLSITELQTIFKNEKIAFIGDSMVRNVYHSLNALMDHAYVEDNKPTQKHVNQKYQNPLSNSIINFFWAPYAKDIFSVLSGFTAGEYKLVVMGASAWDALHNKNLTSYADQLEELSKSQVLGKLGAYSVWLQPTTIIDGRLSSPDKQKFMSESVIETYRQAYVASSFIRDVSFTINPRTVTIAQEGSSMDGVHYSTSVSQVLSQMISNAYVLKHPAVLPSPTALAAGPATTAAATKTAPAAKKPALGPLTTGVMGSPIHGLVVLFFSFIMIFFMDSFFGVGVLSLNLFGRSLDWDSAYMPLLNKIGITQPVARTDGNIQDVEGAEGESDTAISPLLSAVVSNHGSDKL